jgi:hypothetical protein
MSRWGAGARLINQRCHGGEAACRRRKGKRRGLAGRARESVDGEGNNGAESSGVWHAARLIAHVSFGAGDLGCQIAQTPAHGKDFTAHAALARYIDGFFSAALF